MKSEALVIKTGIVPMEVRKFGCAGIEYEAKQSQECVKRVEVL
jgi:hypothetical protein